MNTARTATLALVMALLLICPIVAMGANPSNPTTADPGETDADFAVQGDYVGRATLASGEQVVGAQVVALGEGKFRAVLYGGGLPGDGWDGITRFEGTGARQGEAVLLESDGGSGRIEDGTLVIADGNGQEIGSLKKVFRTSPDEGRQPPQGAVVLFDGSSADAFEGGRLTDDGLLMEGGISKQKFQSFSLHLEFRTPYMPTAQGQQRGNSGCYLQGRYEVQILDSFGLAGLDNECGGIYTVKAPSVNMCYPPLSWQTYDIDFTAARYDEQGKKTDDALVTVRHNGVVVQQDVPVPYATRAAKLKEGPEPGPVYLQDHGNPVRFRNIWLVEGEGGP